jgi:glycosyltransferase involved in cell wall biosynthesis
MKEPLLAILIPTQPEKPERVKSLSILMKELDKQRVNENVIVLIDESGGTTGSKRNRLISSACELHADYISFVDDDDMIGPTYIQRGIEVMESGMDCGELWGNYYVRGKIIKPFHHSIAHREWYEDKQFYYRMPNHLNFQKLELVKQVPFPDQTFGEDGKQSYAMRDAGIFKTEYKIPEVIYHYYK